MSTEHLQQNLFDDIRVTDLIKEIYTNRKEKNERITEILDELQPSINSNTALIVGSTINSCIDASIKNDEILVKLLTVIQKILTTNEKLNDGTLSVQGNDSEMKELIANAINTLKEVKVEEIDMNKLEDEINIMQKNLKEHEYIECDEDETTN